MGGSGIRNCYVGCTQKGRPHENAVPVMTAVIAVSKDDDAHGRDAEQVPVNRSRNPLDCHA